MLPGVLGFDLTLAGLFEPDSCFCPVTLAGEPT